MVRRTLKTVLLLAAEAVLLANVQTLGRRDELQIGWTDLPGWLTRTAPEDAIVAVVRLAAEGVAWWLLATTVLYGLAVTFGTGSMSAAAGRLLPAVLRRWIETSAAVALSVGVLTMSAAPSGATSAPLTAAVRGHAYVPTPAGNPPAPAPPVGQSVATASPGIVVTAGDSLWSIATDLVAHRTERPAAELDDEEISPVWIELVGKNGDGLRSGDPDLIHPGETIIP